MTAAFFRCSSKALLVAAALAGCVDEHALKVEISSLDVTISSPSDLGTQAAPLPSLTSVTISIQAMDNDGKPDTKFTGPLNASLHYLGTLTPLTEQVMMTNGQATATLSLPPAYGEAFLWIDDTAGANPSYATGTSQPIWFRDAFVEDVSTPNMSDPATWLTDDQLEGKQVTITKSKYGANGYLMATGVFVDGYSLTDVDCSVSPCVGHDFNHVYVYTFGRAADATGKSITAGDYVSFVGGGVSEFNGFTELNFPESGVILGHDESKLPQPVVLQRGWLTGSLDPKGMINMEKNESGLVEADNVKFCPLDSDFDSYNQWKIDLGNGCGAPLNVITAGAVSSFDPTTLAPGTTIKKLVGIVRAVNLPTFNVWILYPRSDADITLQ